MKPINKAKLINITVNKEHSPTVSCPVNCPM